MKALALAPALALAAFALAAPPRADASDRYGHDGYRDRGGYSHYDSRGYGNGYRGRAPYYRGDRYYSPRYYTRRYYAPRYYARPYLYGGYAPYYDPYYDDGYYGVGYGYYPPVRRYCPPRHRGRIGVFFGF
jgi:hypothetical protein